MRLIMHPQGINCLFTESTRSFAMFFALPWILTSCSHSTCIVHPYLRQVVVKADDLKEFFNNGHCSSYDLIDVVIHRFNQLDDKLLPDNTLSRPRYFLETDFAVSR